MKSKFLLRCGILAPLVYVFTVVLGGILTPGYSHVAQAVSDLIATGAVHKTLLDPLFAFYDVLSILFGLGLFLYIRGSKQDRGRGAGRLGALTLMAEGVFGICTLLFPEPEGGMTAAITSTGALHIIFAGLSSLTTMLGMLLVGLWFRHNARLRGLAVYSFASVAVVFISGGLAAMSVANQSPIAGLLERITIGGFLQWLFIVAVRLNAEEAGR